MSKVITNTDFELKTHPTGLKSNLPDGREVVLIKQRHSRMSPCVCKLTHRQFSCDLSGIPDGYIWTLSELPAGYHFYVSRKGDIRLIDKSREGVSGHRSRTNRSAVFRTFDEAMRYTTTQRVENAEQTQKPDDPRSCQELERPERCSLTPVGS